MALMDSLSSLFLAAESQPALHNTPDGSQDRSRAAATTTAFRGGVRVGGGEQTGGFADAGRPFAASQRPPVDI